MGSSIQVDIETGWGRRLDRCGSAWGEVVGSCECGNEPSGSTKCREILTRWRCRPISLWDSSFRRGVDKVIALLSCYAVYVGSCLPSFEPWPSEQWAGILPTFAICMASMAVMIHAVSWCVMTQRNATVTECHNLDVRATNAANCTAAFGSHQTITVGYEMRLRWTSGWRLCDVACCR